MEKYKTCTKCKESKQVNSTYFYSDKGQSSGWKPECRDCTLKLKRIFYQNNKEKLKTRAADYRIRNPETWKQVRAGYRKRNPEKMQAERRIRYARKFGGVHKFYTVSQVIETYGTICYLCNKEIDMDAPRQTSKSGWQQGLHIDHVVRLADGGSDDLCNVRPTHGLCNLKKH
jgi:hypothetical protein